MSNSLHAVLIQTRDELLLLPNSAVAEVTTLERFERPEEQAPPWLAGWHATAERRVPVLAVEALHGGARPALSRRSRLVIVHPLAGAAHAGPYALLAKQQPHLLTVDRAGLQPLGTEPGPLGLARVRVGEQDALVADLDMIESALSGL